MTAKVRDHSESSGQNEIGTTRAPPKQEGKMERRSSGDTATTLDTSCTASSAFPTAYTNTVPRKGMSPVKYLFKELGNIASANDLRCTVRTAPALSIENEFQDTTPEQKAAYDSTVIRAIRSQDLETLRAMRQGGRTLQAANNFGESILHMACRRGFLKVVKYLIEEAGVSMWLRDDTGRTPLHDAFWTAEPNFALVDYLVQKDPDMMFITDKRGHLPLDYVRRNDWGKWSDYLYKKNLLTLVPRRKLFLTVAEDTKVGEEKDGGIESVFSALSISGSFSPIVVPKNI